MTLSRFSGRDHRVTDGDVRAIIDTSEKKRIMSVKDITSGRDDPPLYVRAVGGHSADGLRPDLMHVPLSADDPLCPNVLCFQCDLNLNLFMGKTEPVRATGGWDPDLKILEHKDIYIKMKAAGLKLAVCKMVKLDHVPPRKGDMTLQAESYWGKRHRASPPYSQLLPNRYLVQSIFQKQERDVDEEGNIMYLHRQDSGHC